MDKTITPMMKQYLDIKSKYQDAVLFYRLGDFYEMFNEDAREVSRILNLTLTKRGNFPMCGIPYHAATNYIKRLLNLGKKIAICEQTSDPLASKGLVEREVIRVITPGTVIEEEFLEQDIHNYIASVCTIKNLISFSYIDISTSDFFTATFENCELLDVIKKELFRIDCKELLIQESLYLNNPALARYLSQKDSLIVNRYPDWSFDQESSYTKLCAHFKTSSLKGFGIEENFCGLATCGILIDYLKENSHSVVSQITTLKIYHESDFLIMDESALRNLEIVKNLQDGTSSYTLFKVLNHTKTSAGARLLKEQLLNPLKEIGAINARLDKTEFFYRNQLLLSTIRDKLSSIQDIRRICTKIAMDKAHAKDLLGLSESLTSYLEIFSILSQSNAKDVFNLDSFDNNISQIKEIAFRISCTLLDDPPISFNEGNMIRGGFSKELDEIRYLKENSTTVLQDYIQEEKERSNIPTLKLKYNRIIGHYIEVTKSYLEQIPPHFIRRQSLVGGDRFYTEKLKELEIALNSSIQDAIELEKNIFLELRSWLKEFISLFFSISEFLASIDCFQSAAWCATVNGYTRATLLNSTVITLEGARHPVVEAHLDRGSFVANNISLDGASESFIILTAPNMAGKSTLLRQVALIVLMAQAGQFIPASYGAIGIVDKIFCRIGANDNLARGESTFLVEMNETAHILHNATSSSLIIMDEVGRGTSTQEGLAIAQAISEFLLSKKIRTLFATHFHQLTTIVSDSLVNKTMRVSNENNQIVFLKELIDGPASSSYALHVAQMAGVPHHILKRAQIILNGFIHNQINVMPSPILEKQQELFSFKDQLLNEIAGYQLYSKTPLEVVNQLALWQKELRENG